MEICGKIKRSFNRNIREFFDKKNDIKKITQKTNIKNFLICYILCIISTILLFANHPEIYNNSMVPIILSAFVVFPSYWLTLIFIKSAMLGEISWFVPIMITSLFFNTLFYIYSYFFIFICFILLLMAIIILFDDMLQRKRTNLANASEMIKGLKKYINDYSNISDYDLRHIYLWNKYYVYAIAMHIKKI